MSRQSAYERRVTLALKWHHLDNLDNGEIRQRLIDEGYGEYNLDTISRYLNSEPEEEVMERIREKQTNVREQSIERWERKHQRSREAEREATEDEPVFAYRPKTSFNQADRPIYVPDWEVLSPEDHRSPDWQGEHDVVIEFKQNDTIEVQPGEEYYRADPARNPRYRKAIVGVRRDQPDIRTQQSLRSEQSAYQREKATVAGAYEEQVRHHHEGAVAVGELSDEQEGAFEKLTGAPSGGEETDNQEMSVE